MKKKETNPRAAAAASLLSWEKQGRYSNLEVNTFLATAALQETDRALYTALVYGVIERAITLDYIIVTLSSRPISEIDRETLCALRIGLYQLTFMDRIPPHAAVSESVNLVPQRSRGFVNALLRAYVRGGCRYSLPDPSDALVRMSIEYSAPKELCAFWIERYGAETAAQILASTTRIPRVTLCVNSLKATVEDALQYLEEDDAAPCADIPDMISAKSASHIAAGIEKGLFFVQDITICF